MSLDDASPDATIFEEEGALHIVFPPPAGRWIAWVWLVMWTGMFGFGLYSVVRDLPKSWGTSRTQEADGAVFLVGFLLLFVSLWCTIGGLGLYRLLFAAAGREVLVVDREVLTLRREVPFWTRVWTYELDRVAGLRALRSYVPFAVSRGSSYSRYPCDLFGLTGGVIGFRYDGRKVRVGGGIDEAEAERVVGRIVGRHPEVR